MQRNWMMDIETLSVHPTNAVVLSIALVNFEMTQDRPKLGAELVVLPNLREQFAIGRQADKSTQAWWREQSDEAREAWGRIEREVPVQHCLDEIAELLAGVGPVKEQVVIWSHGSFDYSNIGDLYRQWGDECPWNYNEVRDERTIVKSTPVLRPLPAGAMIARDHAVLHDAVHDCRRQIWNLWTHWVFPPTEADEQAVRQDPGEEHQH